MHCAIVPETYDLLVTLAFSVNFGACGVEGRMPLSTDMQCNLFHGRYIEHICMACSCTLKEHMVIMI